MRGGRGGEGRRQGVNGGEDREQGQRRSDGGEVENITEQLHRK